MFHSFCDRGEPENALDVFDREQLLCWGAPEAEDEPVWGPVCGLDGVAGSI